MGTPLACCQWAGLTSHSWRGLSRQRVQKSRARMAFPCGTPGGGNCILPSHLEVVRPFVGRNIRGGGAFTVELHATFLPTRGVAVAIVVESAFFGGGALLRSVYIRRVLFFLGVVGVELPQATYLTGEICSQQVGITI